MIVVTILRLVLAQRTSHILVQCTPKYQGKHEYLRLSLTPRGDRQPGYDVFVWASDEHGNVNVFDNLLYEEAGENTYCPSALLLARLLGDLQAGKDLNDDSFDEDDF
jgi:hypothetical protein